MAWRWFCAVQDVLLHTAGTLKWNFQCPFVRELMLALGLVDVSPTTLLKVFARPTEFRELATFSAACDLAVLLPLRIDARPAYVIELAVRQKENILQCGETTVVDCLLLHAHFCQPGQL